MLTPGRQPAPAFGSFGELSPGLEKLLAEAAKKGGPRVCSDFLVPEGKPAECAAKQRLTRRWGMMVWWRRPRARATTSRVALRVAEASRWALGALLDTVDYTVERLACSSRGESAPLATTLWPPSCAHTTMAWRVRAAIIEGRMWALGSSRSPKRARRTNWERAQQRQSEHFSGSGRGGYACRQKAWVFE